MESFLKKADEQSRRRFLSHTAKSFLGVGLLSAAATRNLKAASAKPGQKPTARNVIYLYMAGGMSHVDTFDPKPGNERSRPINTTAEGIQISEHLPLTAQQMDKVNLVRGVNSTQGAHEQGNYYMQTSYTQRGTIAHPGLGAWMLKLEGKTNRTLPGAVSIGSSGPGAGFMESKFAPLVVGNPDDGLVNSTRPSDISKEQFDDRMLLADQFNARFQSRYDQKHVRAYDSMYDDALKLMRSEDLAAFDISKEDGDLRDAYGRNGFGQGCLLARRLVENDVRFVSVTLGGWDMHNNIYDGIPGKANVLDNGLATLLNDLERRGLLDETLVVLATEFGRTPSINENDGRDHFPRAFSCLMAGGGIQGGRALGVTDDRGAQITEGKVSVPDFNATIAYSLGLPLEKTIYSPSKRPFTVAHKGEPIMSMFG